MTEVLEPQFTYARDPYSKRVITLCYQVNKNLDEFIAIVGIAMNRPIEQFSKKIGRRISQGRMENVNSLVCIPLKSLRKTERREEILQSIAGNEPALWDNFVDPLMARIMREYLWHRDIEAVIEKGLDRLMGIEYITDPHETSLREIPPPQEDYIEPVPC